MTHWQAVRYERDDQIWFQVRNSLGRWDSVCDEKGKPLNLTPYGWTQHEAEREFERLKVAAAKFAGWQ